MTSKRIVLAAVAAYALLSLLLPRCGPIQILETAPLLLMRPCEALLRMTTGARDQPPLGLEDAGAPEGALPIGPRQEASLWWRCVLNVPAAGPGRVVLGGRVGTALGPARTRFRLDMGPSPPVERGDPVVCGNHLCGFVSGVEEDGKVQGLFLDDRASPLVAAEIREGIAGGRVDFVAGGASRAPPPEAGLVPVRFPSSRLGLESGAQAVTSGRFNRPEVPAGLGLGRVRVFRDPDGLERDRTFLVPSRRRAALGRMAVVVPADRAGVAGRRDVPPLALRYVPAGLALPPGWITARTLLRLHDGLEAGVSPGLYVAAGGFLTARVGSAGLFAATAELLLRPGATVDAVRLTPDGPRSLGLEVVERRAGTCRLALAAEGTDLLPGTPLYLRGAPCAGAGLLPICRIARRTTGGAYLAACGPGADRGGYCLVPGR